MRSPASNLQERPLGRDLALLSLLCGLTSFIGLDAIGLVNWQESIRLVTSIDMHERGAWFTPTVDGQPYLAKPPVMYIAVRAIAELRSVFAGTSIPTTFDLRLAAAIFGWVSVMLTALATRSMLTPACGKRFAQTAGLWAGLFLATGILHVRSSRIGEVDIAIVPFVVGGIWASWSFLFSNGSWRAVAAAGLCAAGATLAKGPPALAPLLLAVAAGLFAKPFRAATIARCSSLVLGLAVIGAASLLLWTNAVSAEFGQEAIDTAAREETVENLTLFDPRAPIRTLEAMAYAVGLGSLGLPLALLWLVTSRPKLGRGFGMIIAWALLVPAVFAMIGSGAGRYLTPVWPAVAILAAVWFTEAIARIGWGRLLSRTELALVLLLGLGQGWWYGIGRANMIAEDSPRDLVHELLLDPEVDPERLAVLAIWTGALDAYAGTHVDPVQLGDRYVDYPNPYWNLAEFSEQVRRDGAWTLLVPEHVPDGPDPWVSLTDAGLSTEPLGQVPRFIPMKHWGPLVSVRVTPLGE